VIFWILKRPLSSKENAKVKVIWFLTITTQFICVRDYYSDFLFSYLYTPSLSLSLTLSLKTLRQILAVGKHAEDIKTRQYCETIFWFFFFHFISCRSLYAVIIIDYNILFSRPSVIFVSTTALMHRKVYLRPSYV